MTNPTTPLPVQEPAGAVEAHIRALVDLAKREASHLFDVAPDAEDMAHLSRAIDNLATFARALASLPPVTQAKSEVVAWQFRDRTSSPWCWISCNNETFAQCSEKPSLYEVRPLYAAPQEAVERQPLTGWQPIETAPKGGCTLLLGYFNECNRWRTLRGQWFSREIIDEEWENAEDCEEGWYETPVEGEEYLHRTNPTHWQPLPKPPGIGPATQEKQHG